MSVNLELTCPIWQLPTQLGMVLALRFPPFIWQDLETELPSETPNPPRLHVPHGGGRDRRHLAME